MLALQAAGRPTACSSMEATCRANARPQQRPQTILASQRRARHVVRAKGKAGDPPDVPKARDQPAGGREWLQSILSRFGPVKEKASNTTVLDFEKPLVELDNRIKEVRRVWRWGLRRGKRQRRPHMIHASARCRVKRRWQACLVGP